MGLRTTEKFPSTSVLPNPSSTDGGYPRGMGGHTTTTDTQYTTITHPEHNVGWRVEGGEEGEKREEKTHIYTQNSAHPPTNTNQKIFSTHHNDVGGRTDLGAQGAVTLPGVRAQAAPHTAFSPIERQRPAFASHREQEDRDEGDEGVKKSHQDQLERGGVRNQSGVQRYGGTGAQTFTSISVGEANAWNAHERGVATQPLLEQGEKNILSSHLNFSDDVGRRSVTLTDYSVDSTEIRPTGRTDTLNDA